jgi:aryl-alcohol dehydrogenase-like predicted oxidoreductase
MNGTNRREFLRAAAAGLALAGAGATVLAAQQDSPAGLPTRPLGDTGEKVSIVGLGGWHIGGAGDEREAVSIMHQAIDNGITFFDNAWEYRQGKCEEWMGKALDKGHRDKIFLMTKVCARDYEGARQQLEESLRRLNTDRLDLWQFHEINYPAAPDFVFEQGAIRAAVEAQKAGKIRFIGFTGHKDIDIHLKMLAKPFDWDAAQMPINILDAHYRSFQKKVVPECNRRKIGVLGMKSLGAGEIPRELGLDAKFCRRYALSLPISTLICGIESRKDLEQDLSVARGFKPMTPGEIEDFLAETKAAGSEGGHEAFKTSTRFDSGYHRAQHDV